MSLEATETMRSTMDTCLRFISGEKSLSKEEIQYQVNSFFKAAKEIQDMFDHVLSMDTSNKQSHRFQVQEEIEALREEVAAKDELIAKVSLKLDEWEERFQKLNTEQHNELCAL